MLKETSEDKKIINNAISAYFLFFISSLFLLNRNNKYLNNPFVKSHSKVAFLIHVWFLLTLVIFGIYWLWESIIFFWYALNNLISCSLFIIFFMIMLFWIYKSNSLNTFVLLYIKIINFKLFEIFNIWEKKVIIVLIYIRG